jgi:hypothetical protein
MKPLRDRDVWKVSDETGEIKLIIPNHPSFKAGTSISLLNCYAKSYESELQLHAKLFSTLTSTEIGTIAVGSLVKKTANNTYQRNKPRGPLGQNILTFVKINDL